MKSQISKLQRLAIILRGYFEDIHIYTYSLKNLTPLTQENQRKLFSSFSHIFTAMDHGSVYLLVNKISILCNMDSKKSHGLHYLCSEWNKISTETVFSEEEITFLKYQKSEYERVRYLRDKTLNHLDEENFSGTLDQILLDDFILLCEGFLIKNYIIMKKIIKTIQEESVDPDFGFYVENGVLNSRSENEIKKFLEVVDRQQLYLNTLTKIDDILPQIRRELVRNPSLLASLEDILNASRGGDYATKG